MTCAIAILAALIIGALLTLCALRLMAYMHTGVW